ncbi:MAG: AEC family transporter, partial [Clostridiales bacterium]
MNYVFEKMGMMFFIVVLGYGIGKMHKFDNSQRQALSFIVVNVALPAMILKGVFSGGDLPIKDAVTMLLIGSAAWVILFLIVKIIPFGVRAKGHSKNMYEFMGIFTNNGFMGFPVIETILGAEGLLCAGLLNLPINLFVFSYGIFLLSGGKSLG